MYRESQQVLERERERIESNETQYKLDHRRQVETLLLRRLKSSKCFLLLLIEMFRIYKNIKHIVKGCRVQRDNHLQYAVSNDHLNSRKLKNNSKVQYDNK